MDYLKDRKNPYINFILIAVNVCYFLFLEMAGSSEDLLFMVDHGAMIAPAVLVGKEYYRLFTAMFMHFGIEHLINNMLLLFILGAYVERALGHGRYLLFYLVCGAGANAVSMLFHATEPVVSAGASGAVFGVIGGLLYIVLRNHGRLEDLNSRQMVVLILLALYFGFASSGVDNIAHVAGLLIGFVCGILLYWKHKDWKCKGQIQSGAWEEEERG